MLHLAPVYVGCSSVVWWTIRLGFKFQVRSECLTCTFSTSCCSTRLSRAHVPAYASTSVWDRKRKGWEEVGTTREVRAVQPGSVAGSVMEFGMSRMIKPKEKYVHISNEGNWDHFWTDRQKVKSFRVILTFLYAPLHMQDSSYHSTG